MAADLRRHFCTALHESTNNKAGPKLSSTTPLNTESVESERRHGGTHSGSITLGKVMWCAAQQAERNVFFHTYRLVVKVLHWKVKNKTCFYDNKQTCSVVFSLWALSRYWYISYLQLQYWSRHVRWLDIHHESAEIKQGSPHLDVMQTGFLPGNKMQAIIYRACCCHTKMYLFPESINRNIRLVTNTSHPRSSTVLSTGQVNTAFITFNFARSCVL